MEFGLQTYTIRRMMQKPSALDAAFAAIKSVGLSEVELAVDYLGFDLTDENASLLREAAEKNGIRIASCQIKYSTLTADLHAAARRVKTLGASHVTLSVIDVPLLLKGRQGVLQCCERENRLFEMLGDEDIMLSHHNHHFEFLKADGETVMDLLAENFRGKFALDTYWIARGGANHLTLLEKLKGRVEVMHLRDYELTANAFGIHPGDAAVGRGNIPFDAVIRAAEACGVQYGFIEQNTKSPLENIQYSVQTLQNIGR